MVDTAMKMNPPQELNQLYVINGIDGNNAPFETTCLFILASPLVFFFSVFPFARAGPNRSADWSAGVVGCLAVCLVFLESSQHWLHLSHTGIFTYTRLDQFFF